MIRCRVCKTNFSERKGIVLEHCRLSKANAIRVLDHLREGSGTRSTGRAEGKRASRSKFAVYRYGMQSLNGPK